MGFVDVLLEAGKRFFPMVVSQGRRRHECDTEKQPVSKREALAAQKFPPSGRPPHTVSTVISTTTLASDHPIMPISA